MSISVRCRCGKRFNIKSAAAGKKFRCSECDSTLRVPDETDDLEEIEDDEDEFEDEPVRRTSIRRAVNRSSRKSRRRSGGVDLGPAIRIVGLICGILGYVGTALYLIAAVIYGVILIVVMSSHHGPAAPVILSARIGLSIFFGVISLFAARAACGQGIDERTEEWKARTIILAGALVACIPWVISIAAFFMQ